MVVYTGVFGILGREMSVKELLMKKGNKTKDNKKNNRIFTDHFLLYTKSPNRISYLPSSVVLSL